MCHALFGNLSAGLPVSNVLAQRQLMSSIPRYPVQKYTSDVASLDPSYCTSQSGALVLECHAQ
jgi:hypothetical protein